MKPRCPRCGWLLTDETSVGLGWMCWRCADAAADGRCICGGLDPLGEWLPLLADDCEVHGHLKEPAEASRMSRPIALIPRGNVRVADLVGGDVVALDGRTATFIGRSHHPKYSGLELVVWRLDDGATSLDALDVLQVVGDVVSARDGWADRLDAALGGAS